MFDFSMCLKLANWHCCVTITVTNRSVVKLYEPFQLISQTAARSNVYTCLCGTSIHRELCHERERSYLDGHSIQPSDDNLKNDQSTHKYECGNNKEPCISVVAHSRGEACEFTSATLTVTCCQYAQPREAGITYIVSSTTGAHGTSFPGQSQSADSFAPTEAIKHLPAFSPSYQPTTSPVAYVSSRGIVSPSKAGYKQLNA
ncbi:hypothetical protein B0H63DRAFT_87184 [Podospora didyma]|uniref:Uncharacterized protein n=1 Tax=Podospora didyma TaxID=330526 RepID=A0AAE0K0T5_9PEZI|nr:hypothetical protein B0H63DRAFT_87184 [Podospora didyma]